MEIPSFADLVGRLGLYFVTVLLGLFLHGFGTLSILFILATKKLPCRYIARMGQLFTNSLGQDFMEDHQGDDFSNQLLEATADRTLPGAACNASFFE
ncbi:Amino acid transporter, partial [Operophtera brumata]